MADLRLFGGTSNLVRFKLVNSTTGNGLTGLTGSSSGLIISTIADVESSATVYTAAASHIQTIATLGTFAAPSASDCRFGEVDSTNHPGLYEFQFADARFAVSNAKRLVITVSGATNLLQTDYEIELVQFNPFDAVRIGLTALPAVASGNAGALLVDGTGTAAISNSGGKVLLQATQTGVTIPTVTNLTNAPTNGDLTATMKASVTAAVPSTSAIATALGGVDGNGYLNVNIIDILGTTYVGTAGFFMDWAQVQNQSAMVNLSETAIYLAENVNECSVSNIIDTNIGTFQSGSTTTQAVLINGTMVNATKGCIIEFQAPSATYRSAHYFAVITGVTNDEGTAPTITFSPPLPTALTSSWTFIGTYRASNPVVDSNLGVTVGSTSSSNIVSAIFSNAIETGVSFLQAVQRIGAATAGVDSGAVPGSSCTVVCLGLDGATTRLTATVDANGNATGITYV